MRVWAALERKLQTDFFQDNSERIKAARAKLDALGWGREGAPKGGPAAMESADGATPDCDGGAS
jgi:hypothetical protein